jgi:hypothetical protein
MAAENSEDAYLRPIVTLSFEVADEEDEPYRSRPNKDYLYGMALELRQQMLRDIDGLVRDNLGPDMQVIRLELTPGSVHILILIGQVYSVTKPIKDFLLDFSRYENLIKSLEKLKSQIVRLLRRFFTRGGAPEQNVLKITGQSQIDPAIVPTTSLVAQPTKDCRVNTLLIAYLVASHAALLGLLMWLIVRHLR